MHLFVLTPTGRTITLEVEPTDTILTVKQMIERRTDIPPAQRILTFQGTVLQSDMGQTLSDYSIQNDSTLVLQEAPPPPLPTTKAQCMNGGWQTFGVFRNQGDCVSFVATGGRNPPSGS